MKECSMIARLFHRWDLPAQPGRVAIAPGMMEIIYTHAKRHGAQVKRLSYMTEITLKGPENRCQGHLFRLF